MASDDPFHSEPQSMDYTIAFECLIRILAAPWRKATCFIRQKQKLEDPRINRQVPLIEPDCMENQEFHDSIFNRVRRSRTHAFTEANSSPNPFFTINTPSHPGVTSGRASRTDSRTSRRSRFRPTARLSTLTGTINANRDMGRVF